MQHPLLAQQRLVIELAASLMMLFGFRTRPFIFIVWLSTLAVIVNVGIPADGTSRYLIALLFVSTFLPLGARYSLDASMNTEKERSSLYFAPASVVFTLQVFLMLAAQIIPALQIGANHEQGLVITMPTVASFAGLVALMPKRFMDALTRSAQAVHMNRLRIYYDRDCGFCHKILHMGGV